MKTILICPTDRSAVSFLSQSTPLVNLPILGEKLIGHWLESLAMKKIKEVLVLAVDRPDQVREAVGSGKRWGLTITVQSELHELSPDEAQSKYASAGWDCPAILMDHLPQRPEHPLFASYQSWFSAILAFLPEAAHTNQRIGFREIQPGVWAGLRTQIANTAVLHAPCWLGENVSIGHECVIGPGAILEDRVMVESTAEVLHSVIGPETFVGALTRVEHSIAWGSTLIDWKSGSCTHVPDAFLLSPLGQQFAIPPAQTSERWSEIWSLGLLRAWELLSGRKARLRH